MVSSSLNVQSNQVHARCFTLKKEGCKNKVYELANLFTKNSIRDFCSYGNDTLCISCPLGMGASFQI